MHQNKVEKLFKATMDSPDRQKDNWSSDNWSFDNWTRDNWASRQLVFWTTGLFDNWTFRQLVF